VFGIQWHPPVPDVEVARRVVTFLEDRRVLYAHGWQENPEHCAASIIEIRQFLTEVLGEGHIRSELADSLRAMRAASRKFLRQVGAGERGGIVVLRPTDFGIPHGLDVKFNEALGQVRAIFGLHVAQLAVRYGIDVEDDLASIMPGLDVDPSDRS
jgi:hypothetical protein